MNEAVDLIVTTYNHPYEIEAFLNSYTPSQNREETILVMDVDPTKQNRNIVDGLCKNAGVHVIHTPKNIYYAGACNLGAAYTNSPLLVLLNDDVLLNPTVIDECCDKLVSDDSYGSLGPLQTNLAGRVVAGGIVGSPTQPMQRGWMGPPKNVSDVVEDTLFIMGSAIFTKRTVWDEMLHCELYRDIFPNAQGPMCSHTLYFEDNFYGCHLRGHGYKNVYLGTSSLTHKWHVSIRDEGDTWGAEQMVKSREVYRRALDHHGIEHE